MYLRKILKCFFVVWDILFFRKIVIFLIGDCIVIKSVSFGINSFGFGYRIVIR